MPEEGQVLVRQRPVEPEPVINGRDDLRRRPSSDHDPNRVARDEMDQDEREQRDADDHRHAVQETLGEVGRHGRGSAAGDGDPTS